MWNSSVWMVVLSSALVAGCSAKSAGAPAQGPTDRTAARRPAIAAKCDLPSATKSGGANSAAASENKWEAPRVFIEVAFVKGDFQTVMGPHGTPGKEPDSPTPDFSTALADPRLLVSRVGHVMATNGAPSKLAWDTPTESASAGCPPTDRRDLTLTARVNEDGSAIALEVDLAPAPPLGTAESAWIVPEHRRSHTTAVVRDQQSIVLAGFDKQAPSHSASILVVTPYLLRGPADLRALFECKLKRRTPTAT